METVFVLSTEFDGGLSIIGVYRSFEEASVVCTERGQQIDEYELGTNININSWYKIDFIKINEQKWIPNPKIEWNKINFVR